ncbi:MAG TPA: hypothetical protein VFZ16_11740 [Hyphomicrobiaceae bacterium]|nr:hypothetical protein [Hyphomicrobiaceae bacterium]
MERAPLEPKPTPAGGGRKRLQETVERMWCGLTAMQTLIDTCRDEHGGVDEECFTSLGFVLGSLGDLLEDGKAIDGADVRPAERAA